MPVLRTDRIGRVFHLMLAAIACLAVVGWGAGLAAAQQNADARPDAAASGAGGASSPAPQTLVEVGVEQFGVGSIVRPGDWAGVRLKLTYNGTRPIDVAVRLHLPDPNGDTLFAQRRVTLNVGRQPGLWLYGWMPRSITPGSLYTVSIHELTDLGVGSQIDASPIPVSSVAEPWHKLLGVIGRGTVALDQYDLATVNRRSGVVSTANESIDVIGGLMPQDLPDRWEGLAPFGTLVWTEANPAELGVDRPRAIVEWVRRGGHLVVVMPSVGGLWYTSDDPLAEIMPVAEPVRVEGASLEDYRDLITTPEYDDERLAENVVLHAFEIPEGVEASASQPLFAGPHGVVAVRRIVGVGMVTVIGLDLTSPDYTSGGVLRADAFWNRVLGKRLDTPAKPMPGPSPTEVLDVDAGVGEGLTFRSQAGAGVLLALIVFIAFWLLGGPGLFALLKARGLERHAWVAFVAVIGVFTAVSWVGATTLSDKSPRGRHLTILDHVRGQSVQRTRTYVNAMMPGYGDRVLAVGDPDDQFRRRQTLAPWSAPRELSSGATSFPDARGYVVDLTDDGLIESPVRSTVKRFRADWLGPLVWETPRAVDPGWEPRMARGDELTGRLTHGLPGVLRDVQLIQVVGQRSAALVRNQREGGRVAGPLLFEVRRWEYASWAPGEVKDLSDLFARGGPNPVGGLTWFDSLAPPAQGFRALQSGGLVEAVVEFDKTEAARAAWLPLLKLPNYVRPELANQHRTPRVVELHGLDLAKFATQPALIITGRVAEEESPTPLLFGRPGGLRELETVGDTWVRVVFPLRGEPVRFEDPSP